MFKNLKLLITKISKLPLNKKIAIGIYFVVIAFLVPYAPSDMGSDTLGSKGVIGVLGLFIAGGLLALYLHSSKRSK